VPDASGFRVTEPELEGPPAADPGPVERNLAVDISQY